ncbi:MAG: WhiB family transcriptional regulator [Nitrososphaerales archaeon]
MNWQEQARCAVPNVDPEIFYPEKGANANQAKKICRECPVMVQCLNHAILRDERHGVWGGMSERERRRMKWMAA